MLKYVIWEYATKGLGILSLVYAGYMTGRGLLVDDIIFLIFFLMVGWIFLMSSFYAREKQVEKRLRHG